MIRTLAAAGIALSLTGCAQLAETFNLPQQSPEQRLENACLDFASAIDLLDPRQMSVSLQDKVSATAALVKPVCGQRHDLNQTGVTVNAALTVVSQGLANLAALNQGSPVQ